MIDREKVINGLQIERECVSRDCDRDCCKCDLVQDRDWLLSVYDKAIELLKEQENEIKSLRLLVEWAEECDFGFDQFPDEYERYKDEIKDMKYIDGMVHVAKRTLEDQGAFEEGW